MFGVLTITNFEYKQQKLDISEQKLWKSCQRVYVKIFSSERHKNRPLLKDLKTLLIKGSFVKSIRRQCKVGALGRIIINSSKPQLLVTMFLKWTFRSGRPCRRRSWFGSHSSFSPRRRWFLPRRTLPRQHRHLSPLLQGRWLFVWPFQLTTFAPSQPVV